MDIALHAYSLTLKPHVVQTKRRTLTQFNYNYTGIQWFTEWKVYRQGYQESTLHCGQFRTQHLQTCWSAWST